MTGFILLDVAIGIIFVLLTFSLIASALHEAIAGALNWRGKMLCVGVNRLLSDKTLGEKVMGHGLIKGLHGPGSWVARIGTKQNDRPPSNVPPNVFAKSLIEILVTQYGKFKAGESVADEILTDTREEIRKFAIDDDLKERLVSYVEAAATGAEALDPVPGAIARVKERITALGLDTASEGELTEIIGRVENVAGSLTETVPAALQAIKDGIGTASLEDDLKRQLSGVVDHVQTALDAARAELVQAVETLHADIAKCFDQKMDRVIGWYIRQTKLVLFGIGLVLALAVNFDLIGYSSGLLNNQDLREKIVARAEMAAQTGMIAGREIRDVEIDPDAIWFNADSDRDGAISPDELGKLKSKTEIWGVARRSIAEDGGAADELAQANAAYEQAKAELARFDTDGEPGLSGKELTAAAEAALTNLQDEIVRSLATLNDELGGPGVEMGWVRRSGETFAQMICRSLTFAALLSWLIIGIGCTLGGQFWYDLLKNLMKVRTAAAGVATGQDKPRDKPA